MAGRRPHPAPLAGVSVGLCAKWVGPLCAALLVVGVLMPAQASAQSNLPVPRSEDDWREVGAVPPAYPKAENLIKFPTTWTTSDVLVDGATLTVGHDQIVRYTLVIKTAGGAENVSYEGLRCETGQRRVYAFGRRDGTWSPSRASDWRPILDTTTNRHYFEFWRDLFCDGKVTERHADILRNLPRGGRERQQFSPAE